jgi:hypothetical protein
MASGSDAQPGISESDLARLANVNRARRAGWAKLGYLRRRPRYTELDAAELAAFVTLVEELGHFDDTVLAWKDVRSGLRLGPNLVLFDHRGKRAVLVHDASDVGRHMRPGRLYQIVDLTGPIAEIRDTFRRILEARAERADDAQSQRAGPQRARSR